MKFLSNHAPECQFKLAIFGMTAIFSLFFNLSLSWYFLIFLLMSLRNWICIAGNPTKCSVKLYPWQKSTVILLDPPWTRWWLTKQCKGQPWMMERLFERSFEPKHSHTIGHTGWIFGGGKYHHCSRTSGFENTECWEGCRLRLNQTSNAQSLDSRRSLAY